MCTCLVCYLSAKVDLQAGVYACVHALHMLHYFSATCSTCLYRLVTVVCVCVCTTRCVDVLSIKVH